MVHRRKDFRLVERSFHIMAFQTQIVDFIETNI